MYFRQTHIKNILISTHSTMGNKSRTAIADVSSKLRMIFAMHSVKIDSFLCRYCFWQDDKDAILYQSGWWMVNHVGSQINILDQQSQKEMWCSALRYTLHFFSPSILFNIFNYCWFAQIIKKNYLDLDFMLKTRNFR